MRAEIEYARLEGRKEMTSFTFSLGRRRKFELGQKEVRYSGFPAPLAGHPIDEASNLRRQLAWATASFQIDIHVRNTFKSNKRMPKIFHFSLSFALSMGSISG
jgi:hypothetical protein